MHEVTFFAIYKTTFFVMRIKFTKAVIFFLLNIKPRQSYKTSKNITIYLTT